MQLYNTLSAEERAQLIDEAGKQRLTLSFYAYAKIENPKKFRDDLFIEWNKLDALGRTYVAKEGINAQMSVPAENFEAFREAREKYGLSVQRKCFCCDKTFKDDDKVRLVTVRGGNKLFCPNCAAQAEEQLKKENEETK